MKKKPNLAAWRAAHARNPIIMRPLRFLRDRLQIGKTKDGAPVMHPVFKLAQRAAKHGQGRALQLLAQHVNVHGTRGL